MGNGLKSSVNLHANSATTNGGVEGGASVSLSVTSNPAYWSAKDVCKYLLNNKFDASLVYLIEEHVRSFFFCFFYKIKSPDV